MKNIFTLLPARGTAKKARPDTEGLTLDRIKNQRALNLFPNFNFIKKQNPGNGKLFKRSSNSTALWIS